MFRFFRGLKLWFTNRPYYEQWKRYTKLQKEYRKKLKKQAKEFCPWSGWYLNEMVKTMLEFYHKTYTAGDCCWSEKNRLKEIATSLSVALHWANELDRLADLKDTELLKLTQNGTAFKNYVAAWEARTGSTADSNVMLAALAEEFLTEKYTKALYNIIGKRIWEWYD